MAPGWMQLLLVAVVALLLFGGRGKISSIMGDMAKGIKSFKQGMTDEEEPKDSKSAKEPSRIESKPVSEPHYEHEADRRREER